MMAFIVAGRNACYSPPDTSTIKNLVVIGFSKSSEN